MLKLFHSLIVKKSWNYLYFCINKRKEDKNFMTCLSEELLTKLDLNSGRSMKSIWAWGTYEDNMKKIPALNEIEESGDMESPILFII